MKRYYMHFDGATRMHRLIDRDKITDPYSPVLPPEAIVSFDDEQMTAIIEHLRDSTVLEHMVSSSFDRATIRDLLALVNKLVDNASHK